MRRKYVILGSIALIGLIIPTFSFAQGTECHQQTPQQKHWPHKYTCQNKVDKDNNRNLCGDKGSKNSRPNFSCGSTYLVCHICECPSGNSWQNGSCVKDCTWNEVMDNGVCKPCPSGTTISEDKTKCDLPPAVLTDKEKCQQEINAWKPVQWNKKKGECENCDAPGVCCWTKLNTNVPFIGACIKTKGDVTADGTATPINAFPRLVGGLMQIVTTVMLIGSFLLIVFSGVMMTLWGMKADWFNKGRWLIFKVAGVLALLGLSGIILKVINPSFFS